MQPKGKSWSTAITLTTTISQGNDIEEFSFQETSTVTVMPNALYIRYTEHQEGFKTPTTFKITQTDDILLHRHNQFTDVQLHFVPGKTFQTQYVTSQGNVPIAVKATQLTNQISAEHPYGEINVTYELLNNNSVIGTYALQLVVSENNA